MLDIIRGVAVMGILAMNITAFALPEVAYLNPAAYGGARGADLVLWVTGFVLVDGKMRGLFSFLFGASMLLVIERAEAAGKSAAHVHFARMATLLLFGIAHLVLIWWGDILTLYALTGMVAYRFRGAPPHRLMIVAALLLFASVVPLAGLPSDVWRVERLVASGHADAATLSQWRGYADAFGRSSPLAIAHDLALHRGSYAGLVAARWRDAASDTLNAVVFNGPETLAYMLMGMVAYRSGLLTGAWPRARYRHWAIVAFAVSVPVYAMLAAVMVATQFEPGMLALCLLILSVPVRPIMILGYACLIPLLLTPDKPVARRIAAAGRMAFSNYLLTSVICTIIFYGYGFGLYGKLSRSQLYLVVMPIWAAMLLWSMPWLSRFRYGPLEWMWRSLAQGRLQPMVRAVREVSAR